MVERVEIDDVTKGTKIYVVFSYNSSKLSAELMIESTIADGRLSALASFGSTTLTDAGVKMNIYVGTIDSLPFECSVPMLTVRTDS